MTVKDDLIKGYREFRAGGFSEQKALYETLGTKGQKPKVLVISCADSRVDPSDIFNAYPGELFVARNVANIVPPHNIGDDIDSTSAAIEYAVTALGVEMIMVMGHESCGGVAGCLAGMGDEPHSGYVGKWVSLINEVRDRIAAQNLPEEDVTLAMELENVRYSLENLMTYPFVKDAVEAGKLSLQGAYFSIISAKLLLADEAGKFSEVIA